MLKKTFEIQEYTGTMDAEALGSSCDPRGFLNLNSFSFQLMEALKEQEEINYRLRQYMDKIILAILDHNPSILEIKN